MVLRRVFRIRTQIKYPILLLTLSLSLSPSLVSHPLPSLLPFSLLSVSSLSRLTHSSLSLGLKAAAAAATMEMGVGTKANPRSWSFQVVSGPAEHPNFTFLDCINLGDFQPQVLIEIWIFTTTFNDSS